MSIQTKLFLVFEDLESDERIIESVWAKKLGKNFKIDNIPFYAKSVALEDVFSVKKIDGDLYANELVEESGNSTVRLLFFNAKDVADARKFLVEELNCESELSNLNNLIAVNIPKEIDYGKVKSYLEKGELANLWEYEEGCISKNHRDMT